MNIYLKSLALVRRAVAGSPFRLTYAADGFAVRKKYIPFMGDQRFEQAWNKVLRFNEGRWGGDIPDIRWRCHVCIWAASNCLRLDGDFAEFGVNTGILSSMILAMTDFDDSGKRFFLYDTFEGIPEDLATASEIAHTRKMNQTIYTKDTLEVAKEVFAGYQNIEFVVGRLPQTIPPSGIEKIAYASIDLNSATAEIGVANEIWDKLTPGGMIVLDDYGFGGHEDQNRAWNQFAEAKHRTILAMPTGQGILMK